MQTKLLEAVFGETLLCPRTRLADRFLTRLRGLLFTSALPAGCGLLLRPCGSVHSFGMRYAIDVIYLDARGEVLAVETLRPWRAGMFVRGCAQVLELPRGTAEKAGLWPGCRVRFSPPGEERATAARPAHAS